MLFKLIDRSPRMTSLGKGSQFVWDMFHKIGASDGASHAVGPDDITERERKVLYWLIHRVAGTNRYMDKFPRNCLRASYLQELFPDASFIYIRRDGRSVVSSLITGWKTEGKFGYGIPLPGRIAIEGYDGDQWRFLFPPGWREYATGHTLAEVCAFQWVSANEAVLSAKEGIAPERWVDVSYEELLASPEETVARLFAGIGLQADDEVLTWASELDTHVSRTAVTAPIREKWRREHPEEIASILPMIQPTMRRLGYEI